MTRAEILDCITHYQAAWSSRNATTVAKARVLVAKDWSALNEGEYVAPSPLAITEIILRGLEHG